MVFAAGVHRGILRTLPCCHFLREYSIPLLLEVAMLAVPVLAGLLVSPRPTAPSLLAEWRSLGCKASSSGVSNTIPLPLMLLTSGRSLGALRLELAQPTCVNDVHHAMLAGATVMSTAERFRAVQA